ncbi:MAG: peptidoglycan-associated lipoprotein Pal [Pseudomonadales bacterium]|nr:peptidoglycan-associated lipoprotein Pal [Pseudomonadales bacterium]
MSIFTRKHLIALMAAASIAGCSTTPEESPAPDTSSAPDSSMSSDTADDATFGAGDDSVSGSSEGVDAEAERLKAAAMSSTIVYFDFDKSNVRPDAYMTLKAHAAYLSSNPSVSVRLEGHADERGTREYNLALGERRGNAAANYLTANGASSSQIQVVSYGEERPVAEGHNESSWAQNRRVELKY